MLLSKYSHHFFNLLCFLTLFSCGDYKTYNKEQIKSVFYYNLEANNLIEGTPIIVKDVKKDTIIVSRKGNELFDEIDSTWILGTGFDKEYENTGKEILLAIKTVIPPNKIVYDTTFIRLKKEDQICFWNNSNFMTSSSKEAFNISAFDGLNDSYGISDIVFNSDSNRYEVIIYDCDSKIVNWYGATSEDLVIWKAYNNGKPILTPHSFDNIFWNTKGNKGQESVTPIVSSILKKNDNYHMFVYGDDTLGHTYIADVTTKDILNGPFTIPSNPIISPTSGLQNESVYFPRVIHFKNQYLMFYTGKNNSGDEHIFSVKSSNLLNWENNSDNCIPRNQGWNSAMYNMQTASLKVKNDTLEAYITGARKYKSNFQGNVLDACIGKFISTDYGRSFAELKSNPVFNSNILKQNQNDHLGGIYQKIQFNNKDFLFYQAKGRDGKYRVFVLSN